MKNLTLLNCEIRYTSPFASRAVGGIAGCNKGTIQNCTVIGTVSNYDNEKSVGAIAGENINTGKVENCISACGLQPVVGVLDTSIYTAGTVTGCKSYFRILASSPISFTATSDRSVPVAGINCYSGGESVTVNVTPNDDSKLLADVSFTNTTATKTAYGQYLLTMPQNDVVMTVSLRARVCTSTTAVRW